jgi:peptidoglycan/LPS O-acetylase OafA/YrhL
MQINILNISQIFPLNFVAFLAPSIILWPYILGKQWKGKENKANGAIFAFASGHFLLHNSFLFLSIRQLFSPHFWSLCIRWEPICLELANG